MTGFKTLIYKKKGAIAYLTLHRPKSLNVYNIQMRDELYEILRAIKDDDEVRVVLLNGSGDKAFCAGADLSEFLSAPSPSIARQVRWKRDVWGLFLSLPQPVIAVLHGFVLGSGIEMAMCCDIRIASHDTHFGMPEVGLGIIPAAGGTQTLPRLVGKSKALEMLFLNQWIDADEAYRIGLINQLIPKPRLKTVAEKMAQKIAFNNPIAVRLAKQAVTEGLDLPLNTGLILENLLSKQIRNI